jgi:ABC-2 type transport system ATP-binding protein
MQEISARFVTPFFVGIRYTVNMKDAVDTAIEVVGLTKRYEGSSTLALDTLRLSIAKGEVYGFLGSNGAGKSTTIRLLMGFLRPTAGSATILGYDVQKDGLAARQHCGYLSGDFVAYPKMTGHDFLSYMGALHGVIDHSYVKELSEQLQADLDKPMLQLSKGNRQKIGIIQALMSRPEVLILDEPTSGLDPLMQEAFYAMIKSEKARGSTVFVSSHNLAEVQRMCDRVGIIRGGRLVHESHIADLSLEASQTFLITFEGKIPEEALRAIPGATLTIENEQSVTLQMRGELRPLFTVLAKQHVKKLASKTIDMEEEFLQYYDAGHNS